MSHSLPPAIWPADASIPLLEGSIGDRLRHIAAAHPGNQAVVWPDGAGLTGLTYAELMAEVEAIACWLLERGEPGDRVAIWSRNSLEWLLLEYGCALAGLVVAAWGPAWTDHEVRHAIDLTTPSVILADRDTRGVDLLERAASLTGGRALPLVELRRMAAAASRRLLPALGGGDPFLIQFTSGTTGRSKGVLLSHRAALNAAWLRASGTGDDERSVWLTPIPFSHVGGAVSVMLGIMSVGGTYVLASRFDPGETLRLAGLSRATQMGGVPTMFFAMLDHPDFRPGALRVKSVASGGAQVSERLIERMRLEFNAAVIVTYSQSECPLITTSTPDDEAETVSLTVGRAVPHVEIRICEIASDAVLGLGETGEICIRSPMVMDGYYNMPDATAAAISPDGFLRTGDLGSLDERGRLRIAGRCRDLIIRGGENIYPAEIEDVLAAHPAVARIAVIGIPDERWGQQVAAVIERNGEEVAPGESELEAFAAGRLAHFKIPRHWRFVDALPVTALGKIRKVELAPLFAEEPS